MLVLILVNVDRSAVVGMRKYLDDRTGTVRLRGRDTYEASPARLRLQPLALVRRTSSVGVGCHWLSCLFVKSRVGIVRCVAVSAPPTNSYR